MSEADDPTVAQGADTLVGVLRAAADDGYAAQFSGRPDGTIRCHECNTDSDAASVEVEQTRRLEGASDPADMLLAVRMTCPRCGAKGVLTVGYGTNASDADLAVLPLLSVRDSGPPPEA